MRDLKLWWKAHFAGFTHREAWGYGVWLFFAVLVLVPELWAAFWKDSAPFPTISGTTGELEYNHPILALVVASVIVLCLYSSLRYPETRTGVLAPVKQGPDDGPLVGDPALPYRTAAGRRFTRSLTPVRELAATLYFGAALCAIVGATVVAEGCRAPSHAVVDERRVGRLAAAEVVQVDRAREAFEQALAAAEHARRDDDRQLVDELRRERLADHVCATHDADVLVAGRRRGSRDGLLDTGHEGERPARRLFLGSMRHDEERQPPWVLVAPVPCSLVRPASADDGADPRERVLQPRRILAGRLALRVGVVRPRPAEHPVMEALAPIAEAFPGAVVRARDVTVDGRRDACEHLRHLDLPCRSKRCRYWRLPRRTRIIAS